MKSDIEIKDDIYQIIKGSTLEKAVTGKLKKTRRPANSNKEDIVISILENGSGQVQEAFVNVNIYVSDDVRDGQAERIRPGFVNYVNWLLNFLKCNVEKITALRSINKG